MATLNDRLAHLQAQCTARLKQIEELEQIVVKLAHRVDVLEGNVPTKIEREMWDRKGEVRANAVVCYRKRTGKDLKDAIQAFQLHGDHNG